MVIKATGKEVA